LTLRARLLLAFAYTLVVVIVALEVPLALNLSRRVDAEIKSEAQSQAQLVAAAASGRLSEPDELDSLVERSARDLGGRVIVVDERGTLLADSAGGAAADDVSYASRPEIARALGGRPSQGTRHSDSLDEDLLFTAAPVLVEGRRAGAVRVTQGVDAVQREVRNDVIALVGVGLVALLLGLAVAWLLAGSLAKPLRDLARAARRVSRGDLDARAEVKGSAEQREVASAFNEMTARLSGSLRAQREFVANASHQLRTPLTGLRLRLEAAALKSRDPEVERELTAAEHETQRLTRLLSELLMLAGERERPAPQPVDVGEAVAAACRRWEGPAERSGHVLRLEEGEPAEVAASVEDMAAMLDNLVENALNYSPPGTEVTIGWRSDGPGVRIGVADRGPGVSEAERDRLFERFYRGEAGRAGAPGTGLGLSVVESLAGRWEGEAHLGNRSEGGALAELVLPAHRALPRSDPQLARALPGRD
jgi:two-component system, OmpR family, sensor kinase